MSTFSMDLQQKQSPSLKQLQKLIMTRQMQQAIHLLQMPVMELAPIIDAELQQNPVLEKCDEGEEEQDSTLQQMEEENQEEPPAAEPSPETALKFDERDIEVLRRLDEETYSSVVEESFGRRTSEDDKLQTFLEASIPAVSSLFEHLMGQAQEALNSPDQLALAESLIGNFDENGFLATPIAEIALLQSCSVEDLENVLSVIKTFHPPGVGAANLKDALTLQLKRQGKEQHLAYKIIEDHFDDLLHNRLPLIKKTLRCSKEELEIAIDQIAKLDLHPATQLSNRPTPYITPDVILQEEDQQLSVVINEEHIPRMRLNHQYLKMLDDPILPPETKEFIRKKILSAKWLMKNLMQRNTTLERIALFLAKWDRDFFLNPKGQLVPLTMKTVADELELHESTIARAVSNKYIHTPKGLLPLRSFFTNAMIDEKGKTISSNAVRDLLLEILKDEDKQHPLSDEALSELMKEKGIKCARRTVAKYRTMLNIGNAQQRRKF